MLMDSSTVRWDLSFVDMASSGLYYAMDLIKYLLVGIDTHWRGRTCLLLYGSFGLLNQFSIAYVGVATWSTWALIFNSGSAYFAEVAMHFVIAPADLLRDELAVADGDELDLHYHWLQ